MVFWLERARLMCWTGSYSTKHLIIFFCFGLRPGDNTTSSNQDWQSPTISLKQLGLLGGFTIIPWRFTKLSEQYKYRQQDTNHFKMGGLKALTFYDWLWWIQQPVTECFSHYRQITPSAEYQIGHIWIATINILPNHSVFEWRRNRTITFKDRYHHPPWAM